VVVDAGPRFDARCRAIDGPDDEGRIAVLKRVRLAEV
jgi:hypothetical protein